MERKDGDLVPETATRQSEDTNHHTGRGGAGNEHVGLVKEEPKSSAPIGLADKLKAKLFGKK